MKLESIDALFELELQDLHSAEQQLVKALPKMAEKASSDELRQAFETHLEQTQEHLERLEKILGELNLRAGGHKCKAMEGLVEEGKEIMEEDAEPAMMDLALIGAAQKVEHYEIAGYGTARTFGPGERQTLTVLARVPSDVRLGSLTYGLAVRELLSRETIGNLVRAVSISTRACGARRRSRRQTSTPSRSGRPRSSTTASMPSALASACWPELTRVTW